MRSVSSAFPALLRLDEVQMLRELAKVANAQPRLRPDQVGMNGRPRLAGWRSQWRTR